MLEFPEGESSRNLLLRPLTLKYCVEVGYEHVTFTHTETII